MGAAGTTAAEAAERFAAAHRALRADPAIQFDLVPVAPPPPPPAWLKPLAEFLGRVFAPVGRFLRWLGSLMPDAPFARILLWTAIAVAVAALLWALRDRLRDLRWRRRAAPAQGEAEAWVPDAAPVREWLREADALAAEGRFAEAVHHLLLRSVDDIARRRPQLVRPALTSRELSGASGIPALARTRFAGIAAIVERSLFGGRAVAAAEWEEARASYADFAGNTAWAR